MMTQDEQIEYDIDSVVKAFEKLKKAILEMADAIKNAYSTSGLMELFAMINADVGKSNNYLKYHGRPMKRRRWIK